MKKKKQFKPKIEIISPKNIIDVWRMFDRSIQETHQGYPDLTEEDPHDIRHHLLAYIIQPDFAGLIIKKGRKPVGQILGKVYERPFGRPRRYCFIWNFWIEPEHRKSGYMKLLFNEYVSELKKARVYHWQAEATDDLTKFVLNMKKYNVKKYSNMIGGKAELLKEA